MSLLDARAELVFSRRHIKMHAKTTAVDNLRAQFACFERICSCLSGFAEFCGVLKTRLNQFVIFLDCPAFLKFVFIPRSPPSCLSVVVIFHHTHVVCRYWSRCIRRAAPPSARGGGPGIELQDSGTQLNAVLPPSARLELHHVEASVRLALGAARFS